MNKVQTIIVVAVSLVLASVICSCSVGSNQSDLQKYSDLYIHYCRIGAFDSLSLDAGRVFSARDEGMNRRR